MGCGRSGEPHDGEQNGERFLRCAEPYDDGDKELFRLNPLIIERDGHDVEVRGIKQGLVIFGLIAGMTEPTEANLRNIDYFLEQFKAAGAQAILVPGGVGLLPGQVKAILSRLARAPVPILVCPGALENYDVFREAVAKARQTSPQILDMTLIRRVRVGNVTVVSLPGYHKPFYLGAKRRGCAYTASDLKETAALFDDKSTGVLLSPSPPRGRSEWSVDRGRGAVNIGDTALTEMFRLSGVRFGLFGHVFESGGHATLGDGNTSVPSGVWQESMFVQAGTADAVPISLVGQGRAVGMAQVVEFSGRRGRFRTIYANTGN